MKSNFLTVFLKVFSDEVWQFIVYFQSCYIHIGFLFRACYILVIYRLKCFLLIVRFLVIWFKEKLKELLAKKYRSYSLIFAFLLI